MANDGLEQTEIDALMALRPGKLGEIAREAVRSFYDPTLQRRADDLLHKRVLELEEQFKQHPEYQSRRDRADGALSELRPAIETLNDVIDGAMVNVRTAQEVLEEAQSDLAELIGDPGETLDPPEPKLASAPEPLFTTDDDFATASVKLKARKIYDNDDE